MKQILEIKDPDLQPRLAEAGKIKIGGKGEEREAKSGKKYRLPVKYDHFKITTLERDGKGNFKIDPQLHQIIGDEPRELDIALLHNDPKINFPCRYALYVGARCWCQGDGVAAERRDKDKDGGPLETWHEEKCPCEYLSKGNGSKKKYTCKPHGVLSVMLLQKASLGAVYKFRTTGWNSVAQILGSMQSILEKTGGLLAGIPLKLKIQPKTAAVQDLTTTIYVVYIDTPEGGLPKLLELAREVSQQRRLAYEDVARLNRVLLAPPEGETDADIAEEFYPENDGEVIEGTATATEQEPTTDATPKIDDLPQAEEEPPPEEEPPDVGDPPFADDPAPAGIAKLTDKQRSIIFALSKQVWADSDEAERKRYIYRALKHNLGVADPSLSADKENGITIDQANKLIEWLNEQVESLKRFDKEHPALVPEAEKAANPPGLGSPPEPPDPEKEALILWLADACSGNNPDVEASGANFLCENLCNQLAFDSIAEADTTALRRLKETVMQKARTTRPAAKAEELF